MQTFAVVLQKPEQLSLTEVELLPASDTDIIVDIEWSGISTGTERLLWTGRMPPFPGMGYPLVPGYESVGRVVDAGSQSAIKTGARVFVPGARCFKDVRGLFGGAASRLIVPASRATVLHDNANDDAGDQAVLLALAATARHAIAGGHSPDLIVGHGVLGRLLARLCLATGGEAPVVWERNPDRTSGADGYRVIDPAADTRRDYRAIYDVSGDSHLLDQLIGHLAPGGEVVLAGFYSEPLSFAFPPAFMREARIRIAAEWQQPDMHAVTEIVQSGRLSLDGLITHRQPALRASDAYRTAFEDPSCLKMVLDWRTCS